MLVTIEGIDGAGKNTQTQLLRRRAEAAGLRVGTLAFPRYKQTFLAHAVADYLNGSYGAMEDLPPQFPALLYAGDRLESKPLIEEGLRENDLFLIDRYVASNMAHQAAKLPAAEREALIRWIERLEYEVYGLPRPSLTLYLDVPVAVSARLVAKKAPRDYTDAKADLHERNHPYLAACREVYEVLADKALDGPWARIACTEEDGLRSPEAIHEDLWAAISAHR